MKKTWSRRRYYRKIVGIFLIAVALVAAMMGCGCAPPWVWVPSPVLLYSLNISSTAGGSVTDPGVGISRYDNGTVVDLVASSDAGYRFVQWTGNVDTMEAVGEAKTTITMQGDYKITANFELIQILIPTYELTMAADPELGGTATDVTDEPSYAEGAQVSIKAEANLGYWFINWTATAGGFDNANEAETTFTMPGEAVTVSANFEVIPMVATGSEHTVGLKSDGTVVAVGNNASGQCVVDDWVDIIQVAAGALHTVGLKGNNTVVAMGDNDYGQCDVGDWEDIVQVAAGALHTVGLKGNSTVVAVGDNDYGQCDVGDWEDIIQVSTGYHHTLGLKGNGTVIAVGLDLYGQCNVGGWTDIVQVIAGEHHTVGLKSDGTVVAVGWNLFRQCDVGDWEDIVQVAAGAFHTVGLKSDGTVVAVGLNDYGQCNIGDWEDIVQVAAGAFHTVGLKSDGTVAAVGNNDDEQCDIGHWALK